MTSSDPAIGSIRRILIDARARRAVAVAALLALLGTASTVAAQPNHPFGSHPMPYAAGTIRPSHVSQATLDQAVRDFYDQWKATYVKQVCGPGRYVVEAKAGAGNLTVSEAHGYGMILTALMAGHDPDAKTIFDGMFAYFRDHPSGITPSLMSWFQKTSCANANGNDTASDGDLDIALALLLADKQWGSCGAIDYLAEAQSVIAGIKSGELDATKQYVKLGDWVTPTSAPYYDATRSSDFMPDHYRSFLAATGDATWTSVLDRTYDIVAAIQANHSQATGLLPDFIVDPLGTPDPAPASFLEGASDGRYGYNACRDPWRLGTDFVVSGETRAKAALQAINAWIKTATGGDPAAIRSGYLLNGTPGPNTDYLSMAFVAPLGVGAMVDASNQAWLNAVWDRVVATPIGAEHYYENTLKLLSMIVMSGNWWAPQAVSGGCAPPPPASLCTNGGTLSSPQITIGRLGGKPNDESLQLKAKMFFPQGIPATAPYTAGAQVLIEDLGSGGTAVFELSETSTTPIPPAAAGACDAKRDKWKVTKASTTYKNGSTALDPPTCTAGSARGFFQLQLRPRSARDLDVLVKAKKSSIAPVVGPLRATVVLGATQADGDAGRCAVSAPVACTGAASTRRCR
jgi:endo-1,4-beta-D-glucanase Y